MSGTSDGAGILTCLGEVVVAGVAARRNAKARRAMRDMLAAAALAEQRQEERRRAWLAAVMAQTKRVEAGDGTMHHVRQAQHNPLDDQIFVVPIPKADATPLVFGLELDRKTGATTGRPVFYEGVLPVVYVGVMGAGKSTRFLTPLYMRARNQSIVAFCCKGTGPSQTAAERAKFSNCFTVNPCGVLGINSAGFNPIARFKPNSPRFRRDCIAVAEAIHDPEQGVNNHFRTGSVAAVSCLTGDEVVQALKAGRIPYLPNVRTRLCEPDRWEEYTDANGKPARRLVGGITHTFERIARSGHRDLADMAGKFLREHGKNELAGVISTGETQTRFLHDPAIMADMRGMGVDLTRLCDGDRPSTIFVTIPPEDLDEFNRVVRLLVTISALRSHFRPGKYKTVFVLDEFRATVGTLPIIRNLWSVMREYRAQFLALVTSLTQFETVWGKEWENMIGQAGAVVLLGAAPDPFSARWLSEKNPGRTTIARLGYSENVGESTGDNSGTGFGQSGGGVSSNENAGHTAGTSGGGGLNVTQTEVPAVTAQELMSMRPGEGRAWYPNLGARSVPFFAPNYWKRQADWVSRVGKNPYRGR